MSIKTYELFVGSNKKTGNLETDKLIEVTLEHFEEATISASLIELRRDGQEKGLSVIVKADLKTLDKYIRRLKKVLNLDEVIYHQINKFKNS
ncbi:MAG TPA: hypothetical protein VLG47_04710 [Candidatus Saccharimonadales bacterium]|nr:hypothetical protein [Candidatus Saccharimonadales bacterium]